MIKIYPEIDLDLRCPHDDTSLVITRILIPGMHSLADSYCPECKRKYYVELPVSHGISSPLFLDQSDLTIINPLNVTWLSRPLREGLLNPVRDDLVPKIRKFFNSEKIIIINCLDFLYGHSLLKLLNVQHYLDHTPEMGCCVLVPPQLTHLVPDGVAEIWEFPMPIKDGEKWYNSLQEWMDLQVRRRKEVFLSRAYSHPSNLRYDLNRFVRNIPDIDDEILHHSPIILFSYREDRLWSSTLDQQQQNLQKLHDRLIAIFPDMAFVLIGFGQTNRISSHSKSLIDLRCNSFDNEVDKRWLAYMKAADCAIGVHGSNMLLPSGLAKSTVELIPNIRLGNIFQDILFPHDLKDLRETLLRYRFIYGNDTLSNITTSEVVKVVTSILAYNDRSASWFKVDEESATYFQQETTSVQQLALDYLKTIRTTPPTRQEETRKRLESFLLEGLHRLDIIPVK